MNSYSGALKIKKYLMARWSSDIRDRGNDAPYAYSRTKLKSTGLEAYTGGAGAAIIWEGFYEWTKLDEIKTMERILKDTGLTVFVTEPWVVEVF